MTEKPKNLKELNSIIEGAELKALQHTVRMSIQQNDNWLAFSEIIRRDDIESLIDRRIKELDARISELKRLKGEE